LQNFITRDDIIAYAEEGGDFAQLKEVDSFMEVREGKLDSWLTCFSLQRKYLAHGTRINTDMDTQAIRCFADYF